jgi:hypothetical protein
MCSSSSVAVEADVRALLAAEPGLGVMAALRSVDRGSLSVWDRLVLCEAWEKQAAWVAAQSAAILVEVVDDHPIDDDDFIREDVRAALHLSNYHACERIDVARALHTTLPATLVALGEGRISFPQVAALVKAVALLSPAVAAEIEERVLVKAPDQTVGEFRNTIARAVQSVDPKTAEDKHAAAAERRRVEMYPSGDGMATIVAELPAPDAQTVMLAINAHAHAAGADQSLPVHARRADALTNLCAAALVDPDLPKKHGRPTTLQVVIDLPTLLGLADHPGELLGYGPIPASLARSLAGDGTWQRLVTEPVTGHLLDAGTTRYRPNQELRDYVLTRSPVCDFPTCHTPATDCDIDHAIPYNHDQHDDNRDDTDQQGNQCEPAEADQEAEPVEAVPSREQRRSGGKTSACNCGPRCRRHHRLKTHGGWTVRQHPDGSTTWTNAHGRAYHSPATDHRPGGGP